MGDLERQQVEEKLVVVEMEEVEEKDRLMEGMSMLDFDMLCSTVALQTQGKWRKLETEDFDASGASGGDFGGVFRMWEGEVFDCCDGRRIAIESLWYSLSLHCSYYLILKKFSFFISD